jgi:uncharacterized protein YukE
LLQTSLPTSADDLEAFLRETQATQQRLNDAIERRLTREVVANYQTFISGMRQISEIDGNVRDATVNISNSLRKLGSAKESLVGGTLGIAYRRRRRERIADVTGRLRWVRSLFRVDEDVQVCALRRRA